MTPELEAKLIADIIDIARKGMLPDGDHVGIAMRIWAERWWNRFDPQDYAEWLKS